jgi:hypothetical protein
MKLLELMRGGSVTLQIVFDHQRRRLQETGIDVVTVDLAGVPLSGMDEIVKSVQTSDNVSAILCRDPVLCKYLPATQVPYYVDFCTTTELGSSSPLREGLTHARRVFCYSMKTLEALTKLKAKAVTFTGPFLPPAPRWTKPKDAPFVGVLDTGTNPSEVLFELLRLRREKKASDPAWDFEIVSAIRRVDVWGTDFDYETAESSDVIIAPYDDLDYGQPHEGLILAKTFGIPLITVPTSALEMAGGLVPCLRAARRAPASYAMSALTFIKHPERYPQMFTNPDNSQELIEYLVGELQCQSSQRSTPPSGTTRRLASGS